MRFLSWLLLAAAPASLAPAFAQTAAPQTPNVAGPFVAQKVMIPMRDGAKLETIIIRPRGQAAPLPILLQRTPYGIEQGAPDRVPDEWQALAKDGYIFVEQSMRGRFASDGQFTFSTAVHPDDPKAVSEATDAWDTIDWLVKNVANTNGKVGLWGTSYPGLTAGMALVDPHPALKAVSPQAAWVDYWQGDDLHRNGALRLSYATDWLYMLQKDKSQLSFFPYPGYDTYDFFLRLGPVQSLETSHFKGGVPMFTALLDHPDHDDFYKGQRWADTLKGARVATLNVAGYWDQEDPSGSWALYRKLEESDPDHLNVMVAGAWNHGSWHGAGDSLGRIRFGIASGPQYRSQVEAPFFAYWLHGKGAKPDYEVKSFQSGSWAWKSYAAWPPAGASPTALYLRADGSLSFDAPAGDEGCRDYLSDPANPVPNRPRPISPTYPSPEWSWWEAEDQRFVEGRPDVLSWKSAPLTQDLTITGEVAAELMAATSGTDSDFVVKLIDVYPDTAEPPPANPKLGDYARSMNGYQLPVAMEVKRGRWLQGDATPQPLVPGQITPWPISLRDHDHVFKRGHRLMVQVQSSWFPVIDRNPQSFVPNIARAAPSDFVKATQKVCSGSKLTLPVTGGAPAPQPAAPAPAAAPPIASAATPS